jgi:FixJ family two-component response regulator
MKIEHTPSLLAILDDEKSVLSALQDLIESEGMSTLCFGSAEQFLSSEARHKVACLIADIRMPVLNCKQGLGPTDAEYRSSLLPGGAIFHWQ